MLFQLPFVRRISRILLVNHSSETTWTELSFEPFLLHDLILFAGLATCSHPSDPSIAIRSPHHRWGGFLTCVWFLKYSLEPDLIIAYSPALSSVFAHKENSVAVYLCAISPIGNSPLLFAHIWEFAYRRGEFPKKRLRRTEVLTEKFLNDGRCSPDPHSHSFSLQFWPSGASFSRKLQPKSALFLFQAVVRPYLLLFAQKLSRNDSAIIPLAQTKWWCAFFSMNFPLVSKTHPQKSAPTKLPRGEAAMKRKSPSRELTPSCE